MMSVAPDDVKMFAKIMKELYDKFPGLRVSVEVMGKSVELRAGVSYVKAGGARWLDSSTGFYIRLKEDTVNDKETLLEFVREVAAALYLFARLTEEYKGPFNKELAAETISEVIAYLNVAIAELRKAILTLKGGEEQ